jgi:hypothetical protein
LLWYPDPTGGTGSAVAPTPSTSTAGTTNYYVSQTVNAIEGPRATIEVIVYSPSSSANAGSDQNITSFTTGLLANPPITGTGSWTVVSGTANFADDSNPNTNVSGLSTGDNTLKWTISNGPCSPSSDEVIIHTESAPMTQGISGPVNVIANTQGVTYSIPNDSGATFSWSVPSNAVIVSGQGTNSIVVDFGTQGGTVEVTETNSFGSAVSSATVAVGNAPVTQTISGPANVVSGTNGVNYSVSSNSGSSYTWTIPSGAAIVSGQGTNSIVVDFGTSGGTISVTQTNAFGSANSSMLVEMTITGITSIDLVDIEVYPNPFSDELSLKSNIASGSTLTLKMIDMKGDIIYETDNCPTAKPIILPKALPTGIYMVLIIHNKGMKTVKLEKK